MAFVVVVVFLFFCFFFFTFPSNDWLVPHSRQSVGDMTSDRTQRFHIRTAKQVVDATLGEIATSFPGFSPTHPTGSSTCEDGKKTCTQFFVKTSFDLIMPTSRSNENLQRGYQLNSSFSKLYIIRMFYVCFSPAFSGSRPRAPGSWQL